MQLLATFKARDVENDDPEFDYTSFKPRTAVRAVIFDGDKVALIRISGHGYYMLPGGGVEGEDLITELSREILEELGCKVQITGEVGSAEVYFDRWFKKQTDYCYSANKVSVSTDTNLTDFEKEEGHEVVWANSLSEAISLVDDAKPLNRDGKLVRLRDLLFLKSV